MAIIQEQIEINGVSFIKTYSDLGVLVHGGSPEGDYAEAYDPAEFGRVYTETDIPVGDDASPEEIIDILTGEEE